MSLAQPSSEELTPTDLVSAELSGWYSGGTGELQFSKALSGREAILRVAGVMYFLAIPVAGIEEAVASMRQIHDYYADSVAEPPRRILPVAQTIGRIGERVERAPLHLEE